MFVANSRPLHRGLMLVVSLALAGALAGCNFEVVSDDAKDGLSGVRAAIVAHNYAEAVDMARKYAADNPSDPEAHFELARAEALLGNEGRALDALDAAIKAGLPNAGQALKDPAFAAIRTSARFAALKERATPAPKSAAVAARNLEPGGATVVRAGGNEGVSISESADGTHIRAGDVTLDTGF